MIPGGHRSHSDESFNPFWIDVVPFGQGEGLIVPSKQKKPFGQISFEIIPSIEWLTGESVFAPFLQK